MFKRGSWQVSLKIELASDGANIVVNEVALAALSAAHSTASGSSVPSDEALATLMTIKGVVEAGSASTRELALQDGVIASLKTGMKQVLSDLRDARLSEGVSLSGIMSRLIDEMQVELRDATTLAGTQPRLLKERLEKNIAELNATDKVDGDRLAAEIAITAAKADVREELDRLAAHLQSARDYLASGSPIGRKLDFLSQELNREANTLCSKSISLDLTNVGLTLKGLVDQFKEQAANVE